MQISFEMPEYTGEVTGWRAAASGRNRKSKNPIRYYQASSSEMFGSAPPPQSEKPPLSASPYAAAKVYAYWITQQLSRGL